MANRDNGSAEILSSPNHLKGELNNPNTKKRFRPSDHQKFVEAIEHIKDMRCSVCSVNFMARGEHDKGVPAHRICHQGHLCCAKCIASMLQEKQKNFRFVVGNNMPRYVSFANEFTWNINCPICSTECDFSGIEAFKPFTDFHANKVCGVPDVHACTNEGCGITDILTNDLLRHYYLCPKALVSCKFCDTPCTEGTMQNHLVRECKKLPCSACLSPNRGYSYSELVKHLLYHRRVHGIVCHINSILGMVLESGEVMDESIIIQLAAADLAVRRTIAFPPEIDKVMDDLGDFENDGDRDGD